MESEVERKARRGLVVVYVHPEMRPLPDAAKNLNGAKVR